MVNICFAAGLDWLEGLVPALFLGFWILSQISGLLRRVPKQPGPQRPVDMVDVRAILEREIEQLKQLQRRPGQQVPSAGDATARTGGAPAPRRVKRRPAANQKPPAGGSVVPPPLPTQSAATRSITGQGIDSGIAKHVQEAFAHDLAHEAVLPRGEADSPPRSTVGAATIARMLRDPATIRNAIVLREVLERPTDRW